MAPTLTLLFLITKIYLFLYRKKCEKIHTKLVAIFVGKGQIRGEGKFCFLLPLCCTISRYALSSFLHST